MVNGNAFFKTAWPYQQDKMNLPVASVEAAIPFYEKIMGFKLLSQNDSPFRSVVMCRDDIRIGLAENGGDSSQDGCFFEVNSVEAAFSELKSRGLQNENPDFKIQKHGETAWKVFFVIAPDGLCFCIGERQN